MKQVFDQLAAPWSAKFSLLVDEIGDKTQAIGGGGSAVVPAGAVERPGQLLAGTFHQPGENALRMILGLLVANSLRSCPLAFQQDVERRGCGGLSEQRLA